MSASFAIFPFTHILLTLSLLLLPTSTTLAGTAKAEGLWDTPVVSRFVNQGPPALTKADNGQEIKIELNNTVSLLKPDDPLTGTALVDIDFPYDQSMQAKKAIAELALGYKFEGDEKTRASLIILLDGKPISQVTTLGFSSPITELKKIQRIKLGYRGDLRVTVLCMISRQSTNDKAICSLDSIGLKKMKRQQVDE